MSEVDPVTLEVLRNALTAAAEEMNATLVRTAYSPNIKDRRDCSCAIFDAGGALVSQAETIPVHLGAMPASVRAALDAHPPESLVPGDEILLNDPFAGGAHLPDLTLVRPVFTPTGEHELLGFTANRAHHADIGGSRAGGIPANATEIYQEGLRIPPVKLADAGTTNRALEALVLANVRTPDERRGDLRAQRAANETGRRRLHGLLERYDHPTLRTAFDGIQAYSERRMRSELSAFPDGEAQFEDVLDGDGQGADDLPVIATLTIDGDGATVAFDGTAPQTSGPINAVRAVTVSATYFAMRCVTDPEIPPNAGCYRPIEVRTPDGSIVDADPPAAVVGGNLETSQRVTDAVLGAVSGLAPDRGVAAGQGTMNNLTFGGTDPRDERQYAFYETNGGGFGGRDGADGMDGVHVHMSNTRNTPIEVLETAYPLRVERYSYRPDTGGAGASRGGLGLRRDIRIREHTAQVSVLADRHRHPPYGIAGGQPGAMGAAFLLEDNGPEPIPSKVTLDLEAGSVLSLRTPGGGGYGDPDERDIDAIRRDLATGKLTPAHVASAYPGQSDSIDAGEFDA